MSSDMVLPQAQALSAKAEAVICSGDLKDLSGDEKVIWYRMRCEAAGLDYRTNPFQYILLNNKLVLYATKTATDQIAANRSINLAIVARETVGEAYICTCRATMADGRFTDSIGAVPIAGLKGDYFCNALMKSETKAKRRAVLSITGLGMLDESEVEDIPGAVRPEPVEMKAVPVDTRRRTVLSSWKENFEVGEWARQKLSQILERPIAHFGNAFKEATVGELDKIEAWMHTGDLPLPAGVTTPTEEAEAALLPAEEPSDAALIAEAKTHLDRTVEAIAQ